MFDDRGWAVRAAEFTHRLSGRPGARIVAAELAPPLEPAEVDRLQSAMGRLLPGVLRRFLERGSGALDCRYSFHPGADGTERERIAAWFPGLTSIYGGPRLMARELPDLARSAAQWASETWIAEDPAERATWEGALPIIGLDNGDFLALDVRSEEDDPPVVYLAHDDGSVLLALSMTAFLTAWEAMGYVGPEIWLLGAFRGEEGLLEGEGMMARELRRMLAPGR